MSMVDWNHIIRRKESNHGFSHYLSSFMSMVFTVLNIQPTPRMLPQQNKKNPTT